MPTLLNALADEVYTQLEAQLGKGILETPMGMDILKQAIPNIENQIREQLRSQLEAQLGTEFFTTKEGKEVLHRLSVLTLPDRTNQMKVQNLIR